MRSRTQRHKELLSLLKEQPLSNQIEVVRRMRARGFEVTQSSISRDFRLLQIAKLGGRYLPADEVVNDESDSGKDSRFVLGMSFAGDNLIVVKTKPGAAAITAAAIDEAEHPDVLGTIAGDDTVFLAVSSREAQQRVEAHIITLCREKGFQ